MFGRSIEKDVRLPLWQGAFNLYCNNWLLGVSSPKFENEFMKYRPVSYFQKPKAALRTEHPHNSFLYILCCFGFAGFIVWSILFILPVYLAAKKYNNFSTDQKLFLLCYFFLFIQGLFDKTLYTWPTIIFVFLFAGFLWAIFLSKKNQNKKINSCQ